MPTELCEKCRRHRLVLMFLLIVFAALSGYHWGSILDNANAHVYEHDVIIAGVAFTLLSLVVALWSEAVVGKIEKALVHAHQMKDKEAADALHHKEQVRELERIVERLSQDNSMARYELLSGAVHEMAEAAQKAQHKRAGGRTGLQLSAQG